MKNARLYNAWYVYHHNNPVVYELVCRFADQAIRSGYLKYAISPIWERVRWEINVVTRDRNFKMPNNHRAYYSRHWLNNHPEKPKFFRIARLRSLGNAPVDQFGRDR